MSSSGFQDIRTKPDGDIGLHPKPSRLWLWFVAAFLLQGAMWTAWFVIASHHRVQDVPLVRGR